MLKSEEQVTEKLRNAREDEGAKFSSSCLEYVLLRNWAQPAEYLLEEYFPQTQIDTEIIVSGVAQEVKRQQDSLKLKLLYLKKQLTKGS